MAPKLADPGLTRIEGGLQITFRALGAMAALVSIVAAVSASAVSLVNKNEMIVSAVSHQEFKDTTQAISSRVARRFDLDETMIHANSNANAHQDSTILAQGRQILGLLCGEPMNVNSTFCSDVFTGPRHARGGSE